MARRPKSTRVEVHAPIVPTIIEFLLDETGSMSSCKGQTIGGFNDYLEEQRNQEGSCLLTLTKFDTRGQRTPYTDLDVRMVPNLTPDTFLPGASTNLRDTIVTRINALKARIETCSVKPNVLFVVMTDGYDNASQYPAASVGQYLQKHTEEGWTFVYLGADQDAAKVGLTLGFMPGNIRSFASAEMRDTMQTLAKSTVAYRAARSKGIEHTAETSFFG